MQIRLEKLANKIKKCKKCRLWKTRKNAVPGEGPADAKIMLIGQAPGRLEDETGRPFIGKAGKKLNQLLKYAKISREKCFITSPVKCFPPNNRKPKPEELKACIPYLLEQIRIIKPKIIVLLGEIATKALLDAEFREARGKIYSKDKKIYFVTYHPSAARFPKIEKQMKKDFEKLRRIIKELLKKDLSR